MKIVPALSGHFSFSPCISKSLQIATALSVYFRNSPSADFFDDVSSFLTDGADE
jgi:hypothetical protein